MAYKKGANKVDQNRIAKMAAAGADSSAISKTLMIDEKVVKGFMPKAEPKKPA